MIEKNRILKGLSLLLMIILFSACSNEPQQEVVKTEITHENTDSTSEIAMVMYTLPSPLEIAAIFKKSGMKYLEGVTSQEKEPTKYVTHLGKAINLGVYSADLSYAMLNKQTQTAMEYLKLSRQIAGNLGMDGVYEANGLARRFEKNISREDSLMVIISELQMEMDFYLDENDQRQVTAIAFAGAWVESIYIASVVNEKNKDHALNKKISEQMAILESIINALKASENKEPSISKLVAALQPVRNVYEAFPAVKSEREKDEGEKIVLTDEEISAVSKEIAPLRSKFINGEF